MVGAARSARAVRPALFSPLGTNHSPLPFSQLHSQFRRPRQVAILIGRAAIRNACNPCADNTDARSNRLQFTYFERKNEAATLPRNTWRVRAAHDNMRMRLLLLDTPSGTVCTGFDQGCKDRARKPFLAVIQ